MVILREVGHGVEYQAYDVRKKLGLAGVRTLDIRFYFLGGKYVPPTENKPPSSITAQPGEYLILDFLRSEAE